ncbi:MAG: hypothetical protein K8S99_12440 [Planctomycetes bacterium]|nr:hypothetical protein [Planctomycetota bacterium]
MTDAKPRAAGGGWPVTLWVGAAVIVLAELLIYMDVRQRGGLVVPTPDGLSIPPPDAAFGALGVIARYVAINMTAICWMGYLALFDGLLTALARRRHDPGISSIRARPNRFIVAWLTSIPVWCFFDWVNFYYMDAWRYHGLPPQAWQRYVGYFIAFAAISPGMFMAAQLYQYCGLHHLRTGPVRIPAPLRGAAVLLGAVFAAYPFFVREPVANLTLWVSLMFLLDPLNHAMGAPSIVGDWMAGRWGRTVSLMAGGATCGFLWEFWNYWALAKWTYHLPFLGGLEGYRYFEMPWMGFQGFLPFAVECWVVLNFFEAVLSRVGVGLAERLPDDKAVF